jgi:pimeloyl-ACP methyl ester carboxylesterase
MRTNNGMRFHVEQEGEEQMPPSKILVMRHAEKLDDPEDPNLSDAVGGDLYGGAYRRDPALLRNYSVHIRPPRGRGYFYQLLSAWGWTSLPWLGSLRQPTLIMHGTADPIVPLINAKILAALIRNATLYTIDDGHLFLVTRASEVAPVVRNFLTQKNA